MTIGIDQLCALILLELMLAFIFDAFYPMEDGTKRHYLFERFRLFLWSRLFRDQRF